MSISRILSPSSVGSAVGMSHSFDNTWPSCSKQDILAQIHGSAAQNGVFKITPTNIAEAKFGSKKFKQLYNHILVRETHNVVDKSSGAYRFRLIFYCEFDETYYRYTLFTTEAIVRDLVALVTSLSAETANGGQKFFPNHPMPCFKNMQNDDDPLLNQQLQYLATPTLSKFPFMKSQAEKIEEIRNILQHLFSSPSLLLQRWFYDEFELSSVDAEPRPFPMALAEYLRYVGKLKLSNLQRITNKASITWGRLMAEKWKFDTMVVACRPLGNEVKIVRELHKAAVATHWALKFVGKDALLTIELFQDAREDNGDPEPYILRIVKHANTPNHRQVFWHWWVDQHRYFVPNSEKNFMARGWNELRIINSQCVASQIGVYIQAYLTWNNRYDWADNNCQHFIVGVMAGLNRKVAKELVTELSYSGNPLPFVGSHERVAQIDPLHRAMNVEWERLQIYLAQKVSTAEAAQSISHSMVSTNRSKPTVIDENGDIDDERKIDDCAPDQNTISSSQSDVSVSPQ